MHARNALGRPQVAVVTVVGSPAQKVEEVEGGTECRPESDRVSPVMPSVTITEMKEEEEKEGGGELDEVTSEPCSRCVCLGYIYITSALPLATRQIKAMYYLNIPQADE